MTTQLAVVNSCIVISSHVNGVDSVQMLMSVILMGAAVKIVAILLAALHVPVIVVIH